jgi:16S rRNA processing protein RimM
MASTIETLVGVIGRPHGIRGDVLVDVRTDEPEVRFRVGAVLRAEGGDRLFTVDDARDHSGRLLVKFAELADRTAVEQVRGTRLVIDVSVDESPAEPDTYYDRQLVGLRVLRTSGGLVGTVRAVVHLPAQDLLEIETDGGERLVPFVAALVPEVDLVAGHLRLADVVGLLDDANDEAEGDDS